MVKQKQMAVLRDWPIQNNVVFRLADRVDLREWRALNEEERNQRPLLIDIPESPMIHHNHIIQPDEEKELFVSCNEDAIDLRPATGSPLIDKGVHIKGINDDFKGDAPDIGAYEHGGSYWIAGSDWGPDGQSPPQSMAEAGQRAHQLTQGRRLYLEGTESYEMQ